MGDTSFSIISEKVSTKPGPLQEFYGPFPCVDATNSDLGYGTWLCNLAPSLVAMTKQSVRFALVTGETDFRRGNIRYIYIMEVI